MPGFCGRLTATADPYFRGDVETSTLFCIPESGATWPLVSALGVVIDVPFLSGPTARSAAYDISGLGAGKIFDVWATEVSGLAVLGLAEWTKNYGAGLYGAAGYGGLAPHVSDAPYYGIPVNSAATALRLSDGSSLSVDQYRATLIGSIRIADSGGKIKCHSSYDLAREWGIWNRHNQRQIILKGGSSPIAGNLATQLWQYSPAWAPFLNDLTAYLSVFTGRPGAIMTAYESGSFLYIGAPGMAAIVQGAVGWDSTNTPMGRWWGHSFESGNPILCGAADSRATYINQSFVGSHKVFPLVRTQDVLPGSIVGDGHSAVAMFNQELRMMLIAQWMG